MALLNYTTAIPAGKTIGEIEGILAAHGAQRVIKDYDEEGNVTAISFRVMTPQGSMPVKLPADVGAALHILEEQSNKHPRRRRLVPKDKTKARQQASRVAWRIIKDWTEAQMAIIELGQAKLQQVFLPYVVLDGQTGQTVYEAIEAGGFQALIEYKAEG